MSNDNSHGTDSVTDRFFLLACGAMLAVLLIAFKDYIFLDDCYLFRGVASDTLNFNYPYTCLVSDYLRGAGWPGWSFGMGMGQPVFPFCLRDPFDIILYAAGKEHITSLIAWKEMIKIFLGGVVFYKYLRSLSLPGYTAVVGSLCFAFCGFMIIGSCWYVFSFEALNVALLLLAFEQLFTRKKYVLFSFAVFLTGISQPFNLYLYAVLMSGYAILRLVHTGTFTVNNAARVFATMAGLGLIGLLCSAPFLIENCWQLLHSPRGSGLSSYSRLLKAHPIFGPTDQVQVATALLRLFGNNMAGTGRYYNGWINYLEAPAFYCGLPVLLLAPQAWRTLTARKKILLGILSLIWLMPVFFPWFRYAFWLFTGDYYRLYSLFVALLLIYFGMFALNDIVTTRRISTVLLIITLGVLLAVINYPFFPDRQILNFPDKTTPDTGLKIVAEVLLTAYAVLLFLMTRFRNGVSVKVLFLSFMMVEMSFFTYATLSNMEAVKGKDIEARRGYNDYSIDAARTAGQHDSSFFRIDKTFYSTPARWFSLDDAMIQGFRGTSSYNPFNQMYYVRYLQLMGIANKAIENESRWAVGLAGRPVLECENRVKYLLSRAPLDSVQRFFFDSAGVCGDVALFKNRYVLPFGYTYRAYVRESDFAALGSAQKDLESLQACVIGDTVSCDLTGIAKMQLADTLPASALNRANCQELMRALAGDTLSLSSWSENAFSGTICMSHPKLLYLSIPYDDGWQLLLDGRPGRKLVVNGGMTVVLLPPGRHSIVLQYQLPFIGAGLALAAAGFAGVALLFVRERRKKKPVAKT